jgi:beta-lactamase regulating signal transducer with metallopeptidase domain
VGFQQLDTLGRWLVNDLGWVSIEILVLTGIVYTLTKWGGVRSSRTRRWLWTLAVAKPLVTLLLVWPLALGGGPHAAIAPLKEPPVESFVNIPALAEAVSPDEVLARAGGNVEPRRTPAPRVAAPTADAPTPVAVRAAGGWQITGFAVLGTIWLLGSAGLGVYSLIGAVWLLRVRHGAVLMPADELVAACEQYPDAVAEVLARVDVRLTTRISEPCIFGLFRPSILLPAWCLDDNTPPNLEYILLHEGMHYRARDNWFLGLRRVMEVLLWFHPAVWYAGHRAMIEAENVCDEAVVNLAYRHGTASAALMYSSCLMRVLERATRHSFEALVPGVIPTAERIRRLVQQEGPFANSVSAVSVGAVVLLAIVSLPGAGGPRASLVGRGVDALTAQEAPVREILFTSRFPGDRNFNLYAARSDGSGARRITDDSAFYEEASWSPDGSRIATFSMQTPSGGWCTYILDSDGSVLHPLGDPSWGPRAPTWSPDSAHLTATAMRTPWEGGTDTTHNLYLFDADGSSFRRLTDDTADRRGAAWSPDGETVAYLRARDRLAGYNLALMDSDGANERVIHHDEPEGVFQSRPAWSPDSARLAYLVHGATVDEPHELRILDVASQESTLVGLMAGKVGQRHQKVTWVPGHNAVVVSGNRKGDTRRRLYRVSLSTGEMAAISPLWGGARFPSIGPLASPNPSPTPQPAGPAAVGPVRSPHTGHVYYAVLAARTITGEAAEAAAGTMQFEGAQGYLAAITSDEEGQFLLSQFPFAHRDFWLGGKAPRLPDGADPAAWSWSWSTGEEWRYTSWLETGPDRSKPVTRWRTLTMSASILSPLWGKPQSRLMWAGATAGSHRTGFIVEFDPTDPASSLPLSEDGLNKS